MLIVDVLIAGWCASAISNYRFGNQEFGRRHKVIRRHTRK